MRYRWRQTDDKDRPNVRPKTSILLQASTSIRQRSGSSWRFCACRRWRRRWKRFSASSTDADRVLVHQLNHLLRRRSVCCRQAAPTRSRTPCRRPRPWRRSGRQPVPPGRQLCRRTTSLSVAAGRPRLRFETRPPADVCVEKNAKLHVYCMGRL